MTWWVILACAIAFGTKLLGYLLPAEALENKRALAMMSSTTIGLLGALIALRFRAPFIVVVLSGVLAVALGRVLGLP